MSLCVVGEKRRIGLAHCLHRTGQVPPPSTPTSTPTHPAAPVCQIHFLHLQNSFARGPWVCANIYASVPAQPHTHPSRFIRYLTPPFIQPVSHGFIQAASTHTSRQPPPPTYALINTCIYNIHSSVHIHTVLHTRVLIRVRAFGAYSDNMQSVLNNDLVFDYLVIPQLDSVTRC